ncbi:MAG: hypothetical protein IH827_10530 [Myxococcales bacterium]|nr:hypothetical protein [Myxococcales bacterium]
METSLFDVAAQKLERHTGFSQLEARGTLRIALKIAGLTAKSVTAGELCVVFEKVMPDELEKRGVSDAAVACSAVIDDLVNSPTLPDMASSTPLDDVFSRRGGN